MAAAVLEVADAVVAALNGATLSQSFTAERFYVPSWDLQQDLEALHVSVAPRSLGIKPIARIMDDFTYEIDIAVQKRLPKTAKTNAQINAFCDPLVLLTQEILDLFRGKNLDAVEAANSDVGNGWIVYPEHLRQFRLFTSVATLTFKRARLRNA